MIRFTSIGPAVVAYIAGESSIYYPHDFKSLRDSARRATGFVVSLAECPSFDSELVAQFVKLSKSLQTRFAIASPNAHCRRLLRLVGLEQRIAIFDSVEEAAAHVVSPPSEKKKPSFTLRAHSAGYRSNRSTLSADENHLTPTRRAQASNLSASLALLPGSTPDSYPNRTARAQSLVARPLVTQMPAHCNGHEDGQHYLSPELRIKSSELHTASVLPQSPRASFSGWSEVAQRLGPLGGDWYSAKALDEDGIFFSVGDITGHGADAGVRMNRLPQLLFDLAAVATTPEEILSEVNRTLDLDETIATAIVGVLTLSTREIRFASAGHCQPILCDPSGSIRKVGRPGPPLGADPRARFHDCFIVPRPGSRVVLYTDGLLEFDRNLFLGEQRILRAVAELRTQSGPNIAQTLAERVLDGANHPDDIAVLTISF